MTTRWLTRDELLLAYQLIMAQSGGTVSRADLTAWLADYIQPRPHERSLSPPGCSKNAAIMRMPSHT